MKIKFLFLLLVLLNINAIYSQVVEDDSFLDKDFYNFKTELIIAIQKKDTVLLKNLMADKIFGYKDSCGTDGCTKEQFFKYSFDLNTDEPWIELEKIIRFGFKRKMRSANTYLNNSEQIEVYQAPSYLDKFDYTKQVLILGDKVNIREKPSIESNILTQISYDLVSCNCWITNMTKETFVNADGIRWMLVELRDGTKGYVAEKLTSSVISNEITIAKVNGVWKIISISPTKYC